MCVLNPLLVLDSLGVAFPLIEATLAFIVGAFLAFALLRSLPTTRLRFTWETFRRMWLRPRCSRSSARYANDNHHTSEATILFAAVRCPQAFSGFAARLRLRGCGGMLGWPSVQASGNSLEDKHEVLATACKISILDVIQGQSHSFLVFAVVSSYLIVYCFYYSSLGHFDDGSFCGIVGHVSRLTCLVPDHHGGVLSSRSGLRGAMQMQALGGWCDVAATDSSQSTRTKSLDCKRPLLF